MPPPDEPPVMLKGFREDPQSNRLPTPSGKIEIFSETIASFGYDDCSGHPAWFEPAEWLGASLTERYPLHLISHQPTTRLHSQYDHGVVSLESKIRGREATLMHPRDAAARAASTQATSCAFSTTAARASPACGSTTACARRRRAADRRVVRPARSRRARLAGEARQPERAHARQRHLEAHAGLQRA